MKLNVVTDGRKEEAVPISKRMLNLLVADLTSIENEVAASMRPSGHSLAWWSGWLGEALGSTYELEGREIYRE